MRGITLGAREAGSDLPFGTPTHVVLNSFTPETERTTHYFWSTVRSWGLDDANVPKTYKDMTDLAFDEDARIVESQQQLDRQRPLRCAAGESRGDSWLRAVGRRRIALAEARV